MSKCKFEVGKTYKTRAGHDATVIHINPYNVEGYEICYVVWGADKKSSIRYVDLSGRFSPFYPEHNNDLMPPEPEKKFLEGWVNIYPEEHSAFYKTKKLADIAGKSLFELYNLKRIACVHIKQEYVVGEGLDE